MTVRSPGEEKTHCGAEEDVEGVVAGIHDTRSSDERCGDKWDYDKYGFPDFTAVVEDMELASEID